MRTTVELDDELLEHARRLADERQTSLESVIEEALRTRFAFEERSLPPEAAVKLPRGRVPFELPDHLSWDKTQDIIDYLDQIDAPA